MSAKIHHPNQDVELSKEVGSVLPPFEGNDYDSLYNYFDRLDTILDQPGKSDRIKARILLNQMGSYAKQHWVPHLTPAPLPIGGALAVPTGAVGELPAEAPYDTNLTAALPGGTVAINALIPPLPTQEVTIAAGYAPWGINPAGGPNGGYYKLKQRLLQLAAAQNVTMLEMTYKTIAQLPHETIKEYNHRFKQQMQKYNLIATTPLTPAQMIEQYKLTIRPEFLSKLPTVGAGGGPPTLTEIQEVLEKYEEVRLANQLHQKIQNLTIGTLIPQQMPTPHPHYGYAHRPTSYYHQYSPPYYGNNVSTNHLTQAVLNAPLPQVPPSQTLQSTTTTTTVENPQLKAMSDKIAELTLSLDELKKKSRKYHSVKLAESQPGSDNSDEEEMQTQARPVSSLRNPNRDDSYPGKGNSNRSSGSNRSSYRDRDRNLERDSNRNRSSSRGREASTAVCNQFARNGSCSYGSRCRFLHESKCSYHPTSNTHTTDQCSLNPKNANSSNYRSRANGYSDNGSNSKGHATIIYECQQCKSPHHELRNCPEYLNAKKYAPGDTVVRPNMENYCQLHGKFGHTWLICPDNPANATIVKGFDAATKSYKAIKLIINQGDTSQVVPPAPRLVCIETNPGEDDDEEDLKINSSLTNVNPAVSSEITPEQLLEEIVNQEKEIKKVVNTIKSSYEEIEDKISSNSASHYYYWKQDDSDDTFTVQYGKDEEIPSNLVGFYLAGVITAFDYDNIPLRNIQNELRNSSSRVQGDSLLVRSPVIAHSNRYYTSFRGTILIGAIEESVYYITTNIRALAFPCYLTTLDIFKIKPHPYSLSYNLPFVKNQHLENLILSMKRKCLLALNYPYKSLHKYARIKSEEYTLVNVVYNGFSIDPSELVENLVQESAEYYANSNSVVEFTSDKINLTKSFEAKILLGGIIKNVNVIVTPMVEYGTIKLSQLFRTNPLPTNLSIQSFDLEPVKIAKDREHRLFMEYQNAHIYKIISLETLKEIPLNLINQMLLEHNIIVKMFLFTTKVTLDVVDDVTVICFSANIEMNDIREKVQIMVSPQNMHTEHFITLSQLFGPNDHIFSNLSYYEKIKIHDAHGKLSQLVGEMENRTEYVNNKRKNLDLPLSDDHLVLPTDKNSKQKLILNYKTLKVFVIQTKSSSSYFYKTIGARNGSGIMAFPLVIGGKLARDVHVDTGAQVNICDLRALHLVIPNFKPASIIDEGKPDFTLKLADNITECPIVGTIALNYRFLNSPIFRRINFAVIENNDGKFTVGLPFLDSKEVDFNIDFAHHQIVANGMIYPYITEPIPYHLSVIDVGQYPEDPSIDTYILSKYPAEHSVIKASSVTNPHFAQEIIQQPITDHERKVHAAAVEIAQSDGNFYEVDRLMTSMALRELLHEQYINEEREKTYKPMKRKPDPITADYISQHPSYATDDDFERPTKKGPTNIIVISESTSANSSSSTKKRKDLNPFEDPKCVTTNRATHIGQLGLIHYKAYQLIMKQKIKTIPNNNQVINYHQQIEVINSSPSDFGQELDLCFSNINAELIFEWSREHWNQGDIIDDPPQVREIGFERLKSIYGILYSFDSTPIQRSTEQWDQECFAVKERLILHAAHYKWKAEQRLAKYVHHDSKVPLYFQSLDIDMGVRSELIKDPLLRKSVTKVIKPRRSSIYEKEEMFKNHPVEEIERGEIADERDILQDKLQLIEKYNDGMNLNEYDYMEEWTVADSTKAKKVLIDQYYKEIKGIEKMSNKIEKEQAFMRLPALLDDNEELHSEEVKRFIKKHYPEIKPIDKKAYIYWIQNTYKYGITEKQVGKAHWKKYLEIRRIYDKLAQEYPGTDMSRYNEFLKQYDEARKQKFPRINPKGEMWKKYVNNNKVLKYYLAHLSYPGIKVNNLLTQLGLIPTEMLQINIVRIKNLLITLRRAIAATPTQAGHSDEDAQKFLDMIELVENEYEDSNYKPKLKTTEDQNMYELARLLTISEDLNGLELAYTHAPLGTAEIFENIKSRLLIHNIKRFHKFERKLLRALNTNAKIVKDDIEDDIINDNIPEYVLDYLDAQEDQEIELENELEDEEDSDSEDDTPEEGQFSEETDIEEEDYQTGERKYHAVKTSKKLQDPRPKAPFVKQLFQLKTLAHVIREISKLLHQDPLCINQHNYLFIPFTPTQATNLITKLTKLINDAGIETAKDWGIPIYAQAELLHPEQFTDMKSGPALNLERMVNSKADYKTLKIVPNTNPYPSNPYPIPNPIIPQPAQSPHYQQQFPSNTHPLGTCNDSSCCTEPSLDFNSKGPSVNQHAGPSDSDAANTDTLLFRIIDTETIPSRTQKLVTAQIVNSSHTPIQSYNGLLYLVQANKNTRYKINVARVTGIVSSTGTIKVIIMNPTTSDVKIKPLRTLGEINIIHPSTISNPVATSIDETFDITASQLAYASKYGKVKFTKLREEEDEISNQDGISLQSDDIGFPSLSKEENYAAKELFKQYSNILVGDKDPPGVTNLAEFEILTGDSKPIKHAPYKYAKDKRDFIEQEIQELLKCGIITPSNSPWASPIVVVNKPGGGLRMCVDFRALNEITTKDVYPLPLIRDVLDNLKGCKIFSKIDLQKAFHQLPIKLEDQAKTAFITQKGLWEYKFMPFGLANAPSAFQRLMDAALGSLNWHVCMVYMDDIIVYSKNFTDHIRDLRKVFRALSSAGLKAKRSKCEFFRTELKFLGHIICAEGTYPDPEKIAAIIDIPQPTSIKEMKQFMGAVQYYGGYIRNLSSIASPLNDLTKKGTNVIAQWDFRCDEAFALVKEAMATAPVLSPPDWSQPFILYTDASNSGFGAVLAQVDEKGEEHPVRFLSKSLSKEEKNHATIELEAGAMYWAIQKCRAYLSSNKAFTVITDHNPLLWMMKARSNNAKVNRWSLTLQELNFNVKYRKGKENQLADELSRCYPNDPRFTEPTLKELNDQPVIGNGTAKFDPSTYFVNKNSVKYYKKVSSRKTVNITNDQVLEENENIPIAEISEETPEQKAESDLCDLILQDREMVKEYVTLFKEAQLEDTELKGVVLFLNHLKSPTEETSKFMNEQGKSDLNILQAKLQKYHLNKDGLLATYYHFKRPELVRELIVVPKTLYAWVLDAFHNNSTAAHNGVRRTYLRILSRYYWTSLQTDVRQYVDTCRLCQERKPRNPNMGIPVGRRSLANGPWDVIMMDILGPLPETTINKNRYILVVVDQLTRFAITIPLKEVSTITVAAALLKHVYLVFGFPKHVVTDQGVQFTSLLARNIASWLDIRHIFTSTYHPQSNGIVERLNKEIATALSIYVNIHKTNWDRFLGAITLALNTATHSITGFTPFYMMYNREARLPGDLFDNKIDIIQAIDDIYANDWITELEIHAKQAKDIVQKAYEKQGYNFQKRYLKNHMLELVPGQLVYYLSPPVIKGLGIPKLSKDATNTQKLAHQKVKHSRSTGFVKLRRLWVLCYVVKQYSETVYQLCEISYGTNKQGYFNAHISRIKPTAKSTFAEWRLKHTDKTFMKELDEERMTLEKATKHEYVPTTRTIDVHGLFHSTPFAELFKDDTLKEILPDTDKTKNITLEQDHTTFTTRYNLKDTSELEHTYKENIGEIKVPELPEITEGSEAAARLIEIQQTPIYRLEHDYQRQPAILTSAEDFEKHPNKYPNETAEQLETLLPAEDETTKEILYGEAEPQEYDPIIRTSSDKEHHALMHTKKSQQAATNRQITGEYAEDRTRKSTRYPPRNVAPVNYNPPPQKVIVVSKPKSTTKQSITNK